MLKKICQGGCGDSPEKSGRQRFTTNRIETPSNPDFGGVQSGIIRIAARIRPYAASRTASNPDSAIASSAGS
jgi:hypothetical protein